jgi:hypothetical protein
MTRLAAVASLLVLATTVMALPSARAAARTCDRACLRSTLDHYLAAVLKHDPGSAGLAPSYRHTENAINTPPGKGIWQSVTALGKVQRRYADPVSGQVAYYGIVDENGKAAIATARLRVENRTVTEGEWYIAREGDPGLPGSNPPNALSVEGLIATPPPERSLTAAKRLPRETMIAIVNSYFDGITSHDGTVVLAHQGCNRYENGTRVTGRRGGVDDDCVSGLGGFNLANVGGRRVGFVDDEAGVVLGMAVFIRKAGSPVPRNAFSEWFWIEDGKIRNIWTAMYYPGPERPVPNWPPFDGNFPLPAGVIPTPAAAKPTP